MIPKLASPPSSPALLKVFLGGLPYDWEDEQVARFMQGFGQIRHVEIKRDMDGLSKGFGFVTLENPVDLKLIYGRHQHHRVTIEVKELKQKFVFLAFPDRHSAASEQDIERAFAQMGHQVESVELDCKFQPDSRCYAKVNFHKDTSVKYILSKKFIHVGGVMAECLGAVEKRHHQDGHQRGPRPKANHRGQYDSRNHKTFTRVAHPSEQLAQPEGPAGKAPFESKHQKEVGSPHGESTKAAPSDTDSLQQSKLPSLQSSDDAHQEKPVVSAASRKLSLHKGKGLEFYPTQPPMSATVPFDFRDLPLPAVDQYPAPGSFGALSPHPPAGLEAFAALSARMMAPSYFFNSADLAPAGLFGQPHLPAWQPLSSPHSLTKKEWQVSFFTFPGRD